MAENAERGVIFVLKANVDPAAKQVIEQFAQDIASKQSAIDEVIRTSATETAAALQNATGQATQATAQSTDASTKAVDEFFQVTDRAAKAYASAQEQRAKEEAARQTEVKDYSVLAIEELYAEREVIAKEAMDRERDLLQGALDAEKAAYEAYDTEIRRLREKAIFYADEITDSEIENAKRLEEEVVASMENRSKAEDRFRAADAKERQKNVNDAINEIKRRSAEEEKLNQESQRRYSEINSSASAMIGAFAEGTESVMKFAGGIAKLGLIGETDLQKLTDSLLAIQGTVEIFTGLAKGIKAASDGYDAYRKVVLLTTEAQLAMNAAQAAGAAGQVASDLPLMARGVQTASNIGGSIAGVAGTVGLAAGGSGISVFLASIGAAAGAIAGLGVAAVTAADALKNGIGRGSAPGGVIEGIGTSGFNPFFQIMRNTRSGGFFADEGGDTQKAYNDMEAAEKRLDTLRRQRALALELEARDQAAINELIRERETLENQQAQAQQASLAARISAMSAEERRAEIISQIANAENDQSASAENRARQIIQWSQQRLAVEREIHQEQRAAAQTALRSEEDKLRSVESRLEAERNAMMSAEERFGMLNVDEQQQLIDIQRRFQAGAGNVGAEELRKIRGFSGAMDEQITAEARRRAQQGGFGAFQTQDLARIQQLETQRQQIEVAVKAKADVVAKLDIDAAAVAKEINKQIDAQYNTILQNLASQIGLQGTRIRELEEASQRRFSRIP
jgi:hypothetical protein